MKYGLQNQTRIRQLIDIADLQLAPFANIESEILGALRSDDPLKMYWGLTTAMGFEQTSDSLIEQANALKGSDNQYVKIRAIEYLGLLRGIAPQPELVSLINQTDSHIVATEALNGLTYTQSQKSWNASGVVIPARFSI